MRTRAWNLRSPCCSWVISLTHLMNGHFLIRKPMDVWNFWISYKAIVPGWNLLLFFSFSSCCFSSFFFSFLYLFFGIGTLHHLPVQVPLMYFTLSLYLITRAMSLLLLLYITLLYDYNFELKSNKRCSIQIIFWRMLCLHEVLTSNAHVTPHFDLSFHWSHPYSIIMADSFYWAFLHAVDELFSNSDSNPNLSMVQPKWD